jgi:hypothetical protein
MIIILPFEFLQEIETVAARGNLPWLGADDAGRPWSIAPIPCQQRHSSRRSGTLVPETEFQTETGSVAVIHFMVPADGANLVRTVTGQSGRVWNVHSALPLVTALDDAGPAAD